MREHQLDFDLQPIPFTEVDAVLYPKALADADNVFRVLREELVWNQETLNLFGRRIPQPRLSAWYGDASYTYSGLTLSPALWHPLLAELRDRCANMTGAPFNSVLANLYRDGRDSMDWHSDDEKTLGRNPIIASANLGASRRFQLRNRADKTNKVEMMLGDGDVLIMSGRCQHDWQHRVPKTTKAVGARINLTFRHIVNDLG